MGHALPFGPALRSMMRVLVSTPGPQLVLHACQPPHALILQLIGQVSLKQGSVCLSHDNNMRVRILQQFTWQYTCFTEI